MSFQSCGESRAFGNWSKMLCCETTSAHIKSKQTTEISLLWRNYRSIEDFLV